MVRILDEDGTLKHYANGKLHRENGPAVEWIDGDKYWCINGLLHRLDGPAYEGYDGNKEWWIYGVKAQIISFK